MLLSFTERFIFILVAYFYSVLIALVITTEWKVVYFN